MSVNVDPSLWSLRTAGGIPYKLYEGYPKGSFEEDKAVATEKYVIEADRLWDFILESFTDMDVYPGGIWSYTPARSLPGFKPLITTKVDWEPFIEGKPVKLFGPQVPAELRCSTDQFRPVEMMQTYGQFVSVTISYTVGKSDTGPTNILEPMSSTATGEFLLFPARGNSRWEAQPSSNPDGTPYTGPAKNLRDPILPLTKVVPALEWSAKYRRIKWDKLEESMTTLRGFLGKVNSEPMTLLMSQPSETLMFVGFSLSINWTWRSPYPIGEIEMKLSEKQVLEVDVVGQEPTVKGHNHFFNPATGKWDRILKPDGSYVYDTVDLNGMFEKLPEEEEE